MNDLEVNVAEQINIKKNIMLSIKKQFEEEFISYDSVL